MNGQAVVDETPGRVAQPVRVEIEERGGPGAGPVVRQQLGRQARIDGRGTCATRAPGSDRTANACSSVDVVARRSRPAPSPRSARRRTTRRARRASRPGGRTRPHPRRSGARNRSAAIPSRPRIWSTSASLRSPTQARVGQRSPTQEGELARQLLAAARVRHLAEDAEMPVPVPVAAAVAVAGLGAVDPGGGVVEAATRPGRQPRTRAGRRSGPARASPAGPSATRRSGPPVDALPAARAAGPGRPPERAHHARAGGRRTGRRGLNGRARDLSLPYGARLWPAIGDNGSRHTLRYAPTAHHRTAPATVAARCRRSTPKRAVPMREGVRAWRR